MHERVTKLLACEAGESIKPGARAPGQLFMKRLEPVKTGDSVNVSGIRPLSRALELEAIGTWGLRPRLYAYACFAGYPSLMLSQALPYSYRNATNGSTLVARRAGK